MTDTSKPVTRRTIIEHPRHKRRVLVTIHGEAIGFRLEREQATHWLSITSLYDQAELKTASALAGFNTAPCKNPKKHIHV